MHRMNSVTDDGTEMLVALPNQRRWCRVRVLHGGRPMQVDGRRQASFVACDHLADRVKSLSKPIPARRDIQLETRP
jgi:hypothetical protein